MHRVLVYRVESEGEIAALVNPVLEWASEETEPMEEGCLSLPGVLVDVERPVHVRVRAQDERGEPLLVEASGLEARVIQHEMDHLDGVLIVDRTLARPAQARDAHAARHRARAARRRGVERRRRDVAHRLPRHLGVRRGRARAAGAGARTARRS